MSEELKLEIADVLGFRIGTLPIKYLGLPLISTRLKIVGCQPLIDRLLAKVQSWKGRFLSYVGRTVLLKSVLLSLKVYWCSTFILPKFVFKIMESSCMRFLWDVCELKKKNNKVRWSIVTILLSEGGLGITDPVFWNKCATLKHINLLRNNSNTLWFHWVKTNILKNWNFWSMPIPTDCSWLWRNILKLRNLAFNNLKYLTGKGNETSLWHNNWHPRGQISHLLDSAELLGSGISKDTLVSDIIFDNDWRPHVGFDFELDNIWIELKPKAPLLFQQPDKIVSTGSANGKFSISFVVRVCRSVGPKIDWFQLVWFKISIPRHNFLTWMTLHGGSMTQDKMVRCGFISSSVCILCSGNHTENEFHLFFDCSFSTSVWSLVLAFLSYNIIMLPAEEEAQWLLNHFSGNDDLSYVKKLAFNVSIYHLWQEQNNRRFINKSSPTVTVVRLILNSVRLKANCNSLKMVDSLCNRAFFDKIGLTCHFSRVSFKPCTWLKPNINWVALNTDGSLKDNLGGIGGVLRGSNGELIQAFAAGLLRASIYVLEIRALVCGIQMYGDLGFRKPRVQSDSKHAVAILNGSQDVPWESRDDVSLFLSYKEGFQDLTIEHVFRESNKPIDLMAGWCNSITDVTFDSSNFPGELISLANQDAAGTVYYKVI